MWYEGNIKNRGYNTDSGLDYKNCGKNQYLGTIRRMFPLGKDEELYENPENEKAVLASMNDGLDQEDYKESDGPFDYKVEQPTIPITSISEVGKETVVTQEDNRFARDLIKPKAIKVKVERPTKRQVMVNANPR